MLLFSCDDPQSVREDLGQGRYREEGDVGNNQKEHYLMAIVSEHYLMAIV